MVPVPAPNETAAVLSVPGAARGLPGPAPIFSVPSEPGAMAILTDPPLLTVPPSAIVSVPVPLRPTAMFRLLGVKKVEPAPVAVTVPCEPDALPKVAVWPPPLLTVPPSAIVSVPVPKPPTTVPRLVQVEPAPVTVAVPCEPALLPTTPRPKMLLTVPPLWIVSAPVPFWPTKTTWAVAPAVPTTAAFGVTVSMNADVPTGPIGTPAVQLPGVNQSEEIAPVQKVCARVDDVAASNAAATTVVANKCARISPPRSCYTD